MELGNYIIYIICALITIFVIYTYNKCVSYNNYVKEAFSTMDVYLKKRWDLIPNLIEITKTFVQHEKNTFENLAKLRSGNYENLTDNEKLNINSQVSKVLPTIFITCENYPELKSNQHFQKLLNEFSSIENDIANSRKYYNATVREFNTLIEIFPFNIVANIFKYKEKEMFTISEEERQNVEVQF